MKARKRNCLFLISVYLVLNCCISVPNVSAPPPPRPDQFITEMFPNSTAPLQLSYTNTVLTFNTAVISNKVDISFDANYTIYNQENTTTLAVILPFSLAVNTSEVTIEVFANNTLISHDLISVPLWNENITVIDIQLTLEFMEIYPVTIYPITLIKSNATLIKNSTSIIRYRLIWSESNPFERTDIFYMVYHIGTSQDWIGDTSGRVELRVYGRQPHFPLMYITAPPSQVVDIIGGKSWICEWNNTLSPLMDMGVLFYREASPFVEMMEKIAFGFPISIAITSIVIIGLIRSKDRKKRDIT